MLSRRARAYTQAAQSATSGLALRDPAGPKANQQHKNSAANDFDAQVAGC